MFSYSSNGEKNGEVKYNNHSNEKISFDFNSHIFCWQICIFYGNFYGKWSVRRKGRECFHRMIKTAATPYDV